MTDSDKKTKSVAIIGGGAAGAIAAAAFKAENYYEKIRVFERRESAGGTWLYDAIPNPDLPIHPGELPPDLDPPLTIPNNLPNITSPTQQFRFSQTPIYQELTTNVPSIAMSFSDTTFAYGPFVPHHIPRQYIENYFSTHEIDDTLVLNTTVEDVSKISSTDPQSTRPEKWKLTLRKNDAFLGIDYWWEEVFDFVIIANGHYSVPFVPQVSGLEEYIKAYPKRIIHSKTYRSPHIYTSKRVLMIGNSSSGHDISAQVVESCAKPLYISRRSASRWDGATPPSGVVWKPIIKHFEAATGRIVFTDNTYLDEIDIIIYCTGYLPSFPFWNASKNGGPLWDYTKNKLINSYQHTFIRNFPTLGIIGLPRVLTFRSFEYQAIALARLFSERNHATLPPVEEQARWEEKREVERREQGKKFHDVEYETGETFEWLGFLYALAGLPRLGGEGRIPPVLSREVRWAIENVRKYPEPRKSVVKQNAKESLVEGEEEKEEKEWVVVERQKDILAFI